MKGSRMDHAARSGLIELCCDFCGYGCLQEVWWCGFNKILKAYLCFPERKCDQQIVFVIIIHN
jgi:hypothetical protein